MLDLSHRVPVRILIPEGTTSRPPPLLKQASIAACIGTVSYDCPFPTTPYSSMEQCAIPCIKFSLSTRRVLLADRHAQRARRNKQTRSWLLEVMAAESFQNALDVQGVEGDIKVLWLLLFVVTELFWESNTVASDLVVEKIVKEILQSWNHYILFNLY
jgi:hypothetical protein